MRPTSASCRRAEGARPRRRGFTLLELLLVLTLAALLTGLVAPKMWQWVRGAQQRADIDRVRARLEGLPRQAFGDARRIEVGAEGPLPLPEGWQAQTAAPLVFEANGMTAGGRLRLLAGKAVVADWVVAAPAGELRDATAADGPFRRTGDEP